MATYIRYIIVFLFASVSIHAQDTLIKTDGSKLVVKILEIKTSEIKFKYFNYQDGPQITLLKNEIATIIYSNGVHEISNIEPPKAQEQLHQTIQNDTLYKSLRTGDYIKFNIQAGVVMYNSFNNVPRRNDLQMTSSVEYLKVNDKQYATFDIGFNFLFGRSPYVKHVVGANYLRTTGEYDYSKGNIGYSTYSSNTSVVDFINISSGLRFTLFRKLHIEPLLTMNIVANAKTTSIGRSNTYNSQTHVWTTSSFEQTSPYPDVETTLSLSPKISYQLPVKKIKAEMFVSYNLAYRYRLPWYQFGFHIYPIKKLSPTIQKKKINQNVVKEKTNWFSNKKLNIEAGFALNNGFANTDEHLSGVKPSTSPKYKTGCEIGINFFYGRNPYVKHLIFASFMGSRADLLTRTYSYTYETSTVYENIYTTTYNSNVCFLNFGTGIRLIALKHFNFDNALSFNTPIYSKNEIQGDLTKNLRDRKTSELINSSTVTTEHGSSKTYLVSRANWLFMAKVTYEFNIKQNKFGIFCGWNCRWKNNGQWHMFGLTYYPFKKLR